MGELVGGGSEDPQDDSVVQVTAGSYGSETVRYLSPGEELEVRDDGPNYVRVEPIAEDHAGRNDDE